MSNNLDLLFKKYYLLINHYSNFFLDSIDKINKTTHINIYIKGIKILENVFFLSLLYFNTINEVYNNSEKAYVYFIEFINQIDINNQFDVNSENNFDLTIKDAILFSYKKTIFSNENRISEISKNISANDMSLFKNIIKNINNVYILNYDYYNELYNNDFNDFNDEFKNNSTNTKKIIELIYNNYKNDEIVLEKINNVIKTLYNSNHYLYIQQKYISIHIALENILKNINEYNNYNIINIIDYI